MHRRLSSSLPGVGSAPAPKGSLTALPSEFGGRTFVAASWGIAVREDLVWWRSLRKREYISGPEDQQDWSGSRNGTMTGSGLPLCLNGSGGYTAGHSY
jgi:hypothetical protein